MGGLTPFQRTGAAALATQAELEDFSYGLNNRCGLFPQPKTDGPLWLLPGGEAHLRNPCRGSRAR